MIVAGGVTAVFTLIAMTLAKGDQRNTQRQVISDRDHLAASILFQVLVAGGASADDALRVIRRDARLVARVTPGVDVTSWAESYARSASEAARAQLLETAVQFAAARHVPIPLRQYATLLDLSFGLGFHSDALARLRERYGFEYVDHAKDARPRSADRGGGGAPLFARARRPNAELLGILGLTESAGAVTRQEIGAAYRRLVAQHHPDRFHGAPAAEKDAAAARFIELTRAYEELLLTIRD